MYRVYSRYISLENETSFFAGANTGHGFSGLYPQLVDEEKDAYVYILKGGAGTGKSTFMRRVAEEAEHSGFSAETYLCGSDPFSLDCVILDHRIVVLDGTYPHTYDMVYPAAVSYTIDLSRYLQADALRTQRAVLIEQNHLKQNAYAAAFRYFSAAEILEKEKQSETASWFYPEKAAAYLERFLHHLPPKKHRSTGHIRPVRTCALTTRNACRTQALQAKAASSYIIQDAYGCAVPFMEMAASFFCEQGYSVWESRLPAPDIPVELYLEEAGVWFLAQDADFHPSAPTDTCIRMTRFIQPRHKEHGKFRLASKIQQTCIDEGLKRLTEAAQAHFQLESINQASMNFEAMNIDHDLLCRQIRSQLLHP